VDLIVADLGRAGRHAGALGLSGAGRIGAIDEQVAVVVDAVRTVLGGRLALTGLGRGAIGVGAVDLAVTVVVEAVLALADLVRIAAARRGVHAIGVEAVHLAVAVVVLPVLAILRDRRAAAIGDAGARRIDAVGDAVAVVVDPVGADLRRARVDGGIEIVAIG